jgi:hypothetical protein
VNDDHNTLSLVVSSTARADRRHILSILTALPALVRLLVFGPNPAEAKKRKEKGRLFGSKQVELKGQGHRKRKGKKKGKGKKKDRGERSSGGGGNAPAVSNGTYSPDDQERAFLEMINAYRGQIGAGALVLQDQLGEAAKFHSEDMAQKNYFSHDLPNGNSAEKNIETFGYTNWRFVGENIAAGFEGANAAMDAWKSSPEHDRNMRNANFTEIGIGRAFNGSSRYGWYWTTTFGSR